MVIFAHFLTVTKRIFIMGTLLEKTQPENSSTRLDKWLWASRFYKTRAIAKQMIDGGKVYYNGQRTKSGKNVIVGDKIRVRQGYEEKEVIITALADKRRDAEFAATLYEETHDSAESRAKNAIARKQGILLSPASDTKPDKKQRRKLREFKERI